ncbi:MAG: STAS domain-containing protein [Variovorax sp.]|nr:MAG: STAS domain-containing protein [Variovorax sp.]
MAKEESGRLLSKVAKFVRNPLKDWSDLDAQDSDPAAQEAGYSREALKEMIERRQRNDFVRRREFDMLRKLRQREAAGVKDPSATPSSFNISSTNSKNDGRALTLKKIDEIEEQMSQQWWKGRGPNGDSASPADMAAEHGRAYANTTPDVPPDHVVAPDSVLSGGLDPSLLVYDSPLQEAAIRFAHGDDAGAEAIFLQALAPDGPQADHDETWLGLLDFYRAIGDAEKFVATNTRYAQRIKRQGPEWVSLRALARDKQAAAAAQSATAPGGAFTGAEWSAPAQLSRQSLGELTRALEAATGPAWTLDWRALKGIEPDAAAPLKSLFAHWAGMPVQLRFLGGKRLRSVLEAATPSNERGIDLVWWQLRMEALRIMHEADDFELAALNYCITYEVSPPPWEDPQGTYVAVEPSAAGAAQSATRAFSLAGMQEETAPVTPDYPALLGELGGESSAVWHRLDTELADADAPIISCGGLVRIDLAAAGSLLTWVTERDGRGQRVEFVDTHRLIVAFFGVIGIADHAVVTARVG